MKNKLVVINNKKYRAVQVQMLVRGALMDKGFSFAKPMPSKADMRKIILDNNLLLDTEHTNIFYAYAEQCSKEGYKVPYTERRKKLAAINSTLKAVGETLAKPRVDTPTEAEAVIAKQLDSLGIIYHREYSVVPMLSKRITSKKLYILDFYIPSAKLAIEADGSHHYLDPKQKSYDKRRDAVLSKQRGLKTLRIPNYVSCAQGFNLAEYPDIKRLLST